VGGADDLDRASLTHLVCYGKRLGVITDRIEDLARHSIASRMVHPHGRSRQHDGPDSGYPRRSRRRDIFAVSSWITGRGLPNHHHRSWSWRCEFHACGSPSRSNPRTGPSGCQQCCAERGEPAQQDLGIRASGGCYRSATGETCTCPTAENRAPEREERPHDDSRCIAQRAHHQR
jgi:hypothetical protein